MRGSPDAADLEAKLRADLRDDSSTHYEVVTVCTNCERERLRKLNRGTRVSDVDCDFCGCKALRLNPEKVKVTL